MWLPGHLAASFLACTPFLIYYRERIGNRTLVLSYLAFFAAFPDFLHIDDLRIISHSILGLAALTAIAFVVLSLFFEVRRSYIVIAAVAAGTHLIADWMFGHFFPIYPLSDDYVSLNTFNTLADIRVEILLSAAAIIAFVVLSLKSRGSGLTSGLDRKEKWNVMILLLPLSAIAFLEAAYFTQNMMDVGVTITRLMLLCLFLIPLGGTLMISRDLMR
jgi:hypothetical protein